MVRASPGPPWSRHCLHLPRWPPSSLPLCVLLPRSPFSACLSRPRGLSACHVLVVSAHAGITPGKSSCPALMSPEVAVLLSLSTDSPVFFQTFHPSQGRLVWAVVLGTVRLNWCVSVSRSHGEENGDDRGMCCPQGSLGCKGQKPISCNREGRRLTQSRRVVPEDWRAERAT